MFQGEKQPPRDLNGEYVEYVKESVISQMATGEISHQRTQDIQMVKSRLPQSEIRELTHFIATWETPREEANEKQQNAQRSEEKENAQDKFRKEHNRMCGNRVIWEFVSGYNVLRVKSVFHYNMV